ASSAGQAFRHHALIELAACPLIEPNPHVVEFVARGSLLLGGNFAYAGPISVHCVAKFQHLHAASIERRLVREWNALERAGRSVRFRTGTLRRRHGQSTECDRCKERPAVHRANSSAAEAPTPFLDNFAGFRFRFKQYFAESGAETNWLGD